MKRALLLLLLIAAVVFAADITGTWSGVLATEVGNFNIVAKLNVEGNAVTGTVSSESGETKIEKGSIDGDKISFQVTGEYGPMVYSGTFSGDEMKLNLEVMGMFMPLTLTRAAQ